VIGCPIEKIGVDMDEKMVDKLRRVWRSISP